MHIAKCPVKFWYHHPAVAAEPAVEFLATSDGKLYCRLGNGKYESRGEVHAGDTLDAWSSTSVSIVDFLPHARRELVFRPVKVGPHVPMGGGDRETFEAAAEVELTAGDTSRSLWLQRGDQGGMPIPVKTSEGTLAISYGYESLPLGFSLQLKKFTRGMNPGGMGDARFASTVHLHDEAKNIDAGPRDFHERAAGPRKIHVLSVGNPAQRHGHGAHRGLRSGPVFEILGSIMTCAGTVIMFVTRSKLAKVLPCLSSQTNDQDQGATHATQPSRPAWHSFAWPVRPRQHHPQTSSSIGVPGDRCPSRTAAGRSRWTALPGKPGACWATASASPIRRRINRSTRRPSTLPPCSILPLGIKDLLERRRKSRDLRSWSAGFSRIVSADAG